MTDGNTSAGGCHCGKVRWRVDISPYNATILDCNCSICTRKGFLHLIVELEQFELIAGEEALRKYRFNTMKARHLFCSHCGIHSFYRPRSHPDHVDVNARCIDDIEIEKLAIESFDGANWEENVDEIR